MTLPARALTPAPDPADARGVLERLAQNVGRAVIGKPAQVKLALTTLVAGGHLLLEDVPGVGKTTLAEALARSFALSFGRVQLTADLLPSDILGGQVFHAQTGQFTFHPGPIFHQLVLADELNRAPPRTQSALLEAMAQRQVTLDGTTHPLPAPFAVVATQNPLDFAGTYPLPDSQLDRFLARLSLGHPSARDEVELLQRPSQEDPLRTLGPVASAEELARLQRLAAQLALDASVADYAVRLGGATREHPAFERGASTRAMLSLVAAARAHALWEARAFVTPGDVREVFVAVMSHRVLLRASTQGVYSREEAGHRLDELLRKVPEPR